MHRSASTSRASDEFFINLSPGGVIMADIDTTYNPVLDTSKKEITHLKLPGEDFIHLIPLILLICAFTLWAFSYPVVDLSNTSYYEGGKVQGSSNIHGHFESKTNNTSTMEDFE